MELNRFNEPIERPGIAPILSVIRNRLRPKAVSQHRRTGHPGRRSHSAGLKSGGSEDEARAIAVLPVNHVSNVKIRHAVLSSDLRSHAPRQRLALGAPRNASGATHALLSRWMTFVTLCCSYWGTYHREEIGVPSRSGEVPRISSKENFEARIQGNAIRGE